MKKLSIIIFLFFPLFNIVALDSVLSTESLKTYSFEETDYVLSKFYIPGTAFNQGLEIHSKVEDVSLFLNGVIFKGERFSFNDLEPGNYHVRVKKTGYVSADIWIEIKTDIRVFLEVELEREFGYLKINSNVDNYNLYLDDQLINENEKIATGNYLLKVRSFGYEDETLFVTISPGFTTYKNIYLNEAEFEIKGFRVKKRIYNPDSNGDFKENSFIININAPGSGDLILRDLDGREIYTINLDFTDWVKEVVFSENRINLKDGEYYAEIVSDSISKETSFKVDRTLFIKSIPVYNGIPGLLHCPTANTNYTKLNQTSFYFNYDFSNMFKIDINHLINLDKGLSFKGEVSIESGILNLGVGTRGSISFDPLLVGLNINFRYRLDEKSYSIEEPGFFLRADLPLTFVINNYNLSLSPGVTYEIPNTVTTRAGIGFHYDDQLFRAGISASMETVDFRSADFNFGGEFHFLLPNSQSYLGITCETDFINLLKIGAIFTLIYQ